MGATVTLFARVGRFSYTLYVIQLPILFFISALWLRSHDDLPPSPWLAIAGFTLVVVLAILLARIVEYPFMPNWSVTPPVVRSTLATASPLGSAPRSDPA